MFYAYLTLAFAIVGAGLILVPGYYKLLWIAGCFAVAVALPAILGLVLDPLNIRRITRHLAATGATDIQVQPFPNHYGARYSRDGVQRYARCSVRRGKVKVNERPSKARRK